MTFGCDILLESGDLILQEDGASALLTEVCVPIVPPVVIPGTAGYGPRRIHVAPLLEPRIQIVDLQLQLARVLCTAHSVTAKIALRQQAARANAAAHPMTTESLLTIQPAQSRFVLEQPKRADDIDLELLFLALDA